MFYRKLRRALIKVSVLFLASALSLIGAELFLQLIKSPDENTAESGLSTIIVSREFHHDYRPGQIFTRYPESRDEYKPMRVAVNSFGIRGPEIPPKRPGESRILILGDSFIQALHIDYDKTVGRVLERKIDKPDVRVVQHGMSSWSPLLEWNWLLKKGLTLEPNTVVLVLCPNDFWDAESGHDDAAYVKSAIFAPDGTPSFDISPASYWGAYKLQLFRRAFWTIPALCQHWRPQFSQSQIDALLAADERSFAAALDRIAPQTAVPGLHSSNMSIRNHLKLARPSDKWDAATRTNVARSLGYVENIRTLLENKQVKLVITLTPFAWNVSRDEMKIGRRFYRFADCDISLEPFANKIRDYCRDHQVEYVDLLSAFKKYPSRDGARLFLQSDGHWNEIGHAVAADALFEALTASGSKPELNPSRP